MARIKIRPKGVGKPTTITLKLKILSIAVSVNSLLSIAILLKLYNII